MLNKTICLLMFSLAACSAQTPLPAPPQFDGKQLVFQDPQSAVSALKAAVTLPDYNSLKQILGPDSTSLLDSGDKIADQNSLQNFAAAINKSSVLKPITNPKLQAENIQVAMLLVGENEWPFPIPIVKGKAGWQFDTESGKQEIINRRIGENEIQVLILVREYVIAQLEYYAMDPNGDRTPEFATKFISSAGKKDGLYWPAKDGENLSPIGPLVAAASAEGYKSANSSAPQAFNGYFFKILTSQSKNARGGAKNYIRNGKMTDGFGLLAYPAEWDKSGAVSFIVGPDGVVYQKNLGPDTNKLAKNITSFDPDLSWDPA